MKATSSSRGDTLDQVLYACLREDLSKKQHVDAVVSFYNEKTGKVEYTASCHRIALAAKSKFLGRLLASHDGPDDEMVHVVLVDPVDNWKARQRVEVLYDPEKTDKEVASLWGMEESEEDEEEKEEMVYKMEPETILRADEIKTEPPESEPDQLGQGSGAAEDSSEQGGSRVVCVAPGRFFGNYRCEPGKRRAPDARDVLERMSASEKGDFRPVQDAPDKLFCLLCKKSLRISTSGVIKQHCNTATHKKRKEEAMAEINLLANDIKKEINDVPSDEPPGVLGQISPKPKQNAYVPKKVKTLEEVLLDVNIVENFALRAVANSKDRVHCHTCAITLIVTRPIDIKAHCKTAEHVRRRREGKATVSSQEVYDKMISEWAGDVRMSKRKTLQETLDEINKQENGALSVVKGAADKIYCNICECRLTIGHIGEIKRHCKAEKHLKGKESSPYSRASKRQADPQFLFSDELCSDQLSPVYNSRPYKRKTFEETIDEINLQGWNTIESQ